MVIIYILTDLENTLGILVNGDDGLPAEEVGVWALEKQNYLCRYIDISRGVRKKYLGDDKGGATYVDLFCGPGRAQLPNGDFINGSCVAAWHKSLEGGSPFSQMLIADMDEIRLAAAVERLKRAGAPVLGFVGPAIDTAQTVLRHLPKYALNFTFLDPFSLGDLDFNIFRSLSYARRMDIIVHLSKMDLQRNLDRNISAASSAFDRFAPGWRQSVAVEQGQKAIRSELIEYWKDLISTVGFKASPEMQLIRGTREQPLYWLLLIASHDLAHKFWIDAANPDGQGKLF